MREESDIAAVALLNEPARRKLYEWVAGQGRSVSRDEAAAGTGVSRALAAFHLDRLAGAGVLAVEYRRLSGRRGPGAGRPAKLYRRAEHDVAVSLPARRYETAARLLSEAIEGSPAPGPVATLRKAATRLGGEWAAGASMEPAAAGPQDTDAVLQLLAERGYEPILEGGEIRLRNCPFHALVEEHRDLVCGMNLALAQGLLEGFAAAGMKARLAPEPGYCCVRISPGESAGD